MKKVLLLIAVIMALSFAPSDVWAAPGDNANDPIIITSAAGLDNARLGLNKHYRLNSNVDLTAYLASGGAGYSKWGTAGWLPVGTVSAPFTGSFDGNGYKITGLRIDRSSMGDVGLFGVTRGATIKNLGVETAPVGVRGNENASGLIGLMINSSVTNCYVTGAVSGFSYVGGLVGNILLNDSSVTKCYANVNVSGNRFIGGLVGAVSGSNAITNSYATGNVTATGDNINLVGGIVGFLVGGSITNSYATGNVSASGGESAGVGGLVGALGGIMTNCYATGNVNGTYYIGGLAGYQAISLVGSVSAITNSYATGNVSGSSSVSGLVGAQLGSGVLTITNSYRYQLATINGVVRAENTPNGIHGGIRTASQLMTQSTYSGWAFNATAWQWDSRGFPKLNMGTENNPFNFAAAPGDNANNPIIITTAAQLDAARNGLNKHYKLNSNVDLTAYLASGGAGYSKWGTAGWLPIGTLSAPFTGSFNGNGFKVTGLWINRSSMSDVGLLGYVKGATIKSLGVEIASAGVKGGAYVGGLIGSIFSGSVTNCYVTGNVSGNNTVGGLVGEQFSYSGDFNAVTNCYATGDVTATGSYVGGLLGRQYGFSGSNCTITNSYATGNVSGNGQVGGLVGWQFADSSVSSITNCYATGRVSGSNIIGGLVGEQTSYSGNNSSIVNCYATGNVSGTYSNVGGLVGAQTGAGAKTISNSYRYPLATINGVVRAENTPNGIHGGIRTANQLMTQSTYTGWAFNATAWQWDSRGFPKLNMGTENNPFNFASAPGDNANNPIIITTAAQLDAARNGLNKHYRLGSNVDLTAYLAVGGAGYSKWGTAGWLPVGAYSTPFTGSFDGNGYKITGLRIDRSNTGYVGLFGYINGATIRNLGVEIASAGVKGSSDTGGLVGWSNNSSISNCFSTGNVSGGFSVGGLVGYLYNSNATKCYATGNISGHYYIGGLVGQQYNSGYSGAITSCYARGNVIVDSEKAGGLVGQQNSSSNSSSAITNCYATGNVSGLVSGGLVGEQYALSNNGVNTITNSYATGNASGYNLIGGLVGRQYAYNGGSNKITNCYATGNTICSNNTGAIAGWQVSASNGSDSIVNSYRYQLAKINGVARAENTPNGIHGGIKTASQLKTQSTYTGWAFNTTAWQWDSRGFPKLNMGTENNPFSF